MRTALRFALALGLLAPLAAPAAAQGSDRRLYNQEALAELLHSHREDLDRMPRVTWRYHVLSHETGNSLFARAALYEMAGDGDVALGRERLGLVTFLNRVWLQDLSAGDTLIVPSYFSRDPRAYSPYPRAYPGAADLEKLFVIDKSTQTWGAYQRGELERWGLVNTGEKDVSETPNGRFNFNWKEEDRISTLSPPGEQWRMRYVFNFHDRRGIHVHQYAMPTGGPASHGCVRLPMADAQWIYDWADGWVTSNGTAERGLASRGRVRELGTTVLVIGDEPDGAPARFRRTAAGPELVRVVLPEDPFDVPPGTPLQRRFDRQRDRAAS